VGAAARGRGAGPGVSLFLFLAAAALLLTPRRSGQGSERLHRLGAMSAYAQPELPGLLARPAQFQLTVGRQGSAPLPAEPDPDRGFRLLLLLSAVGGGAGLAAVIGGVPGILLGLAAARGLLALTRRMELPASRLRRHRLAADLPAALDLLVVALRAGLPLSEAEEEVGVAVGGPLGSALLTAGRSGRLGAAAGAAWHAGGSAELDRVVRTVARCGDSGAAIAAALSRLAEDLRQERTSSADKAARRAGVLVVLPLGLCFLPAFLCLGVVPVVVGIARTVLP